MDTSQYQSKTSGEWEAFRSDAIIRAAHDDIITAGAIGDIETVNPASELIFGWTAAELAGKNFRFLMPRSDAGKQNSAAAAPSPLISMPNSNNFGEIGEIIVAEARGKPLGISAEAEYTDHHLAFPPGAFLFLYSDALIEGRDEHGDMLGVDGRSSLLSRRSMAKSDSSPLGDVLDLFNARSRLPLQDDLTAIWLSRSN